VSSLSFIKLILGSRYIYQTSLTETWASGYNTTIDVLICHSMTVFGHSIHLRSRIDLQNGQAEFISIRDPTHLRALNHQSVSQHTFFPVFAIFAFTSSRGGSEGPQTLTFWLAKSTLNLLAIMRYSSHQLDQMPCTSCYSEQKRRTFGDVLLQSPFDGSRARTASHGDIEVVVRLRGRLSLLSLLRNLIGSGRDTLSSDFGLSMMLVSARVPLDAVQNKSIPMHQRR
jgi:hypothetical protein